MCAGANRPNPQHAVSRRPLTHVPPRAYLSRKGFGSVLVILMTGPVLVAGCASGSTGRRGHSSTPSPSPSSAESSRCQREGKRVLELDLNNDNEPDVWRLYEKKVENGAPVEVMTCKERDLNFDGRKDSWYYYDDQGNRKFEEIDLDFDGRIDLRAHRRQGKLFLKEWDTDRNGKSDVSEHYEAGELVRIERDSNHDGKIDYWEYYEGGRLDRIGYDKSGDGRVDRWDRANKPREPASDGGGEKNSASKKGSADPN